MTMRSEEQRDKTIDALIERVQALEKEVAKLKGEPFHKEAASLQQNKEGASPRPLMSSKSEQKKIIRKSPDSSLETLSAHAGLDVSGF